MPDVTVRVLGPFEVRLDGEPVDLGAPKQRAVLAFLAAHRGRAVSLDQLIEELWGDQAPPRATASLQAYVSNLRRILEPDRPPRTAATVLVSRPPGYALDLPPDAFDSERFDALGRSARAALAEGRPEEAVADGRGALDLWRGEPLADFPYDAFAEELRGPLSEARLGLHETVAAALVEAGHADEAVAELGPLARAHPLRERFWELLMVALYRSGRQADALRTFQEARTVLAEELGLEPGPGLRRVEQQILDHDPALAQTPRSVPPTDTPAWSPGAQNEQGGGGTEEPSAGGLLIGRHDELATLGSALDDAAAGRTVFVLVSGEAGIGKTTLVESIQPVVEQRGWGMHFGRSFEQAGSAPLWPWAQVVRSLLEGRPEGEAERLVGPRAADLGRLVPVELAPDAVSAPSAVAEERRADRLRLFDAVAALLDAACAVHPEVVVLDDVHWADADSLDLLDFLATERRTTPLVVVTTFRGDEATAGSHLANTLGSLARHGTPVRIELHGFDRADVAAFAGRLVGAAVDDATVDVLEAQTAGNPFFLGELVRLLASEKRLDAERAAEEVPSGVRDVVRRRLDRLPDDSQAVLRIAAVIGRQFTVDELAEACDLDLDAVLDAIEPPIIAGLVGEADGGDAFRFSHALVAAALAEDVPAVRRRRLHARVGRAIERVHRADLDPVLSRLAHHFGEAVSVGEARLAAEYAARAAAQAAAHGAFVESARLWSQADDAAALDPDASVEGRLDLSIERILASSRIASAESRDVVPGVIDRALAVGDLDRAVRAALSLTVHRTTWGWAEFRTSPHEVVERLERLLAAIGPGDSPDRARVLCVRAFGSYYDDPDESLAISTEGVAMARRLGDPALVGDCLALHLVDLERPHQLAEFRAACDELVELGAALDAPELHAMGLAARLAAKLNAAEVDAAIADHRAAGEILERVPMPALTQQLALFPPLLAVLRGDYAGAQAAADEAFEIGRLRSMWDPGPQYLTQLAEIRRETGDLDEMEDLIAAIAADPRRGATNLAALPAIQRGDLDAARRIVERNGGIAAVGRDWRILGEAVWAVDVVHGLDLVDEAAELAELLAPATGQLALTGTTNSLGGPVDLHLGRLATTMGDRAAARRYFETSLEVSRRIGSPPWEAHSLIGLGRLLGGADGDAHLRDGLAIAERLGMKPAVRVARAALQRPPGRGPAARSSERSDA
jgi:DNA-binding SARP family transcriptional activator